MSRVKFPPFEENGVLPYYPRGSHPNSHAALVPYRGARKGTRHSPETKKKLQAAQSSRPVRMKRSVAIVQNHPERFPPDHIVMLQASRREDHKRILWARTLWQQYHITVDDEASLYEAQNGRCPLCGVMFSVQSIRAGGSGHDYGHWRIDHDHSTGIVRGLLCHTCNWHLGFFENIDVIAAYLRRSPCAQT